MLAILAIPDQYEARFVVRQMWYAWRSKVGFARHLRPRRRHGDLRPERRMIQGPWKRHGERPQASTLDITLGHGFLFNFGHVKTLNILDGNALKVIIDC
jgi:hypothetical protein